MPSASVILNVTRSSGAGSGLSICMKGLNPATVSLNPLPSGRGGSGCPSLSNVRVRQTVLTAFCDPLLPDTLIFSDASGAPEQSYGKCILSRFPSTFTVAHPQS